MKAFELSAVTECLLTHTNTRKEFHGEEKVQAIDLNFQMEGANDLLDLIDPALRQALYFNAAAKEGQMDLPEAMQILPNLRVPKLNGQKFKYGGNDKYKGYTFELDYGLGPDQSNIVFMDASAGKFAIEAKEGGTVVIGWQVSYAGDALTDEALTRLVRHEGEKAFIKLLAPAVLQLVKGGKAKAAEGDGEQQESLLDEDDAGDSIDPDSPEGRLIASVH